MSTAHTTPHHTAANLQYHPTLQGAAAAPGPLEEVVDVASTAVVPTAVVPPPLPTDAVLDEVMAVMSQAAQLAVPSAPPRLLSFQSR